MNPTTLRLVHAVSGSADVVVERDHRYSPDAGDAGPLAFRIYRPLGRTDAAPSPAVVLVSGLPDPGVTQFFGAPFRDWASVDDWARALAASGVAAITYENREPADVIALVRHVRSQAAGLGVDPARLGAWASSGNVPTALGVLAREPLACAALLYGYLLDLDGATAVADAAKQFYFAVPAVGLDDLPRDVPILIVRAGQDQFAGLDATLVRFVDAARARGLGVEVVEHDTGAHAFDLSDESPRSHEVIAEVLRFFRERLGAVG